MPAIGACHLLQIMGPYESLHTYQIEERTSGMVGAQNINIPVGVEPGWMASCSFGSFAPRSTGLSLRSTCGCALIVGLTGSPDSPDTPPVSSASSECSAGLVDMSASKSTGSAHVKVISNEGINQVNIIRRVRLLLDSLNIWHMLGPGILEDHSNAQF